MIRLDHVTIKVSDAVVSRDWYRINFGLRVAFENLQAGLVGLEDDGAVELILVRTPTVPGERDCTLTFQCDSVDQKYRELTSHGVAFVHEPKHVAWGYGAELRDPDGYRVLVWDAKTMPGYKAK
jgi:catechol 2,3-dioxygenase-like lactoylglutathione lyase family enzyme